MNSNRGWFVFCALELIWLTIVSAGIVLHKGLPHGDLPFGHFGKILHTYGPILPFSSLSLRAFLQYIFGLNELNTKDDKENTELTMDSFEAYKVFSIVTTTHWILNSLYSHWIAIIKKYGVMEQSLISDRIMLGASLTSILQLEISIVLTHMKLKSNWFIETLMLVNVFFFLCICVDMFYTALYFHSRMDCILGLLQGVVLQYGSFYWFRVASQIP